MQSDRLDAVRSILRAVIRVVTWIAAGALVIIVLTTVIHVVGRYLFNRPLTGSVEISQMMLVITAFFAVAYTELEKGHISFDEVVTRFPSRARAVTMSIMYFAGAAYFFVLSWQEVLLGISFLIPRIGDTNVLHIPIAPAMFIIAIGAVLMGVEMLLKCFSPLSSEDGMKAEEN